MILSTPNLVVAPKGFPKYSELGIVNKDFPFKVFIQKRNENGAVVYYRGVYFESPLFTSFRSEDTQEIKGLLTEVGPANADSGWKRFSLDDITDNEPFDIWLQLEFTKNNDGILEINTASIKDTNDQNQWGGGELEYKQNGNGDTATYELSKARLILARVKKNGDNPLLIQFVSSPLRMEYSLGTAYDSGGDNPKTIGIIYPFPIG